MFDIHDDASGGPGPDLIQIQDTATPGEYRLCTQNAPRRNFCGELVVAG
jgi:hypothetical protein